MKTRYLVALAVALGLAACNSAGTPDAALTSAGSGGSAVAGMNAGGLPGAGSGSTTTAGALAGGSGGQTSGGDSAGAPTAGSAGNETAAGAGGTAEVGLDPTRVPGQNFDLSQWALQLPIASGDSVQQVKDLSAYTSQYFYTAEDGAMVFWCPVTGATTPNSHYPRTELRELPTGGDWDIGGHHRLSAQLEMLQNPPSKGTIIGQIHGNATGGTSEVLKLEWTSDNQIIASVEANDDPAKQINHTIGKYALGALVSYTAELTDSVLTVSVTDDAGTKTFTTPYTAASWKSDKYYFKLGSYVQLDAGTEQQGGRVAFYAFSVEHGP